MQTAKSETNQIDDNETVQLLLTVDRSHGEVKALAETLERYQRFHRGVRRFLDDGRNALN